MQALKYTHEEVGKFIKQTKSKHTWQFTLDGQSHIAAVVVSRLSGYYKILIDTEVITTGNCLFEESFSFGFEVKGQTLQISKSANEYDLVFKGRSFKDLPSLPLSDKQKSQAADSFIINKNLSKNYNYLSEYPARFGKALSHKESSFENFEPLILCPPLQTEKLVPPKTHNDHISAPIYTHLQNDNPGQSKKQNGPPISTDPLRTLNRQYSPLDSYRNLPSDSKCDALLSQVRNENLQKERLPQDSDYKLIGSLYPRLDEPGMSHVENRLVMEGSSPYEKRGSFFVDIDFPKGTENYEEIITLIHNQ
jgi:hypothetical protein